MDALTCQLLEIKQRMADAKMSMSDNDFSTLMLAKSRRYVSWLRATGHAPAIEAMVNLYVRLDNLLASHEAAGNATVAKQIDSMASSLWDTIRKTVLTTVPPRRKQQPATLVDEPPAAA
jgi:hypothetical protein